MSIGATPAVTASRPPSLYRRVHAMRLLLLTITEGDRVKWPHRYAQLRPLLSDDEQWALSLAVFLGWVTVDEAGTLHCTGAVSVIVTDLLGESE